jgi:predicted DNA-binding transcriptional regulator
MSKDQGIGLGILIVCLAVIILYAWGVFFSSYSMFILQLTGFIAVAGILGIGSWIGWTMATTPPPKPLEEVEEELEAQEITEETDTKKEENPKE